MKKVLISCVGVQDPVSGKTGQEGPIVTAVRSLKPDLIFLLPSKDKPNVNSSTENNSRETEEWINELVEDHHPQIFHKPLNLEDPRDYEQLRRTMTLAVNEIKNELSDRSYSFHINISSGTPQMEAMWLTLVNAGALKARLWMVSDPEYLDNPTPENRTKEVKMRFLEEDNLLNRTKELLRQHNYYSASLAMKELSTITTSVERRDAADMLHELFEAYNKWDMLKVKKAKDKLTKIYDKNKALRKYNDITNLVRTQIQDLNCYLGDGAIEKRIIENETNLLDLYHNAKRREEEGNFADCLGRFWRMYEGAMFYLLRKRGIEPNDLDSSVDKDLAQEVKSTYECRDHISTHKAKQILKNEFNEKEIRKFERAKITLKRGQSTQTKSLNEALEELRIFRNDSVAGHNLKPVTAEVADNALATARNMFEIMFDYNQQEIENYSFAGKTIIDTIGDFLESL